MRPLVSILMPCYNAEKFIRYSLESILNQDYSNLEVICINDGSTDNTRNILEEYSSADTRIVIVDNVQNLGLIESLNQALPYVNGEFFARMDADDYCPPERVSKQIFFLSKNPQFDMVASGYHYFIEDNKPLEYVPPIATLPGALKFIALFSTPLNHASTLGRTKLIKNGLYRYDKNFPHSEDYELFSRLAWQGVKMANIKDALYWVRLNPESVSVLYNQTQIESHLKVTKRNLEALKVSRQTITDSFLKTLANRINVPVEYKDLKQALTFLDKCLQECQKKEAFTQKEMHEIHNYLTLHGLNILVQSNKAGILSQPFGHLGFLMRSLSHFRIRHLPDLFKKSYNFIRYRIL